MVIDANIYWIPEELFTDHALWEKFKSVIPAQYDWYTHMEDVPGTGKAQIVMEKPEGCANLNYLQGDYVLSKQLHDMDEAGVDKAVMKLPGCQEWLDLELCRYFNDKAAAHAAASGGRLFPLAVVPPYGREDEIAELKRCHDELGMNAVQMSAHYGDKYLDDPAFAAFFEVLNELGMTVYVHHTPVPVEYETFKTYNNVRRSYGRIVDQGLAIGRELYSGFFSRYPNVKVVHSMMGGAYFAIAGMMLPHGPAPAKKDEISRFKDDNEDIAAQFKSNVFFEMSHSQPWGKKVLEFAVDMVGADHIVYGSSYPVRRVWLDGAELVKQLDVSEEDKELMLAGNAVRLYGLPVNQ